MGKKKDEKKVVNMVPMLEQESTDTYVMTQEEIDFVTARDEEELDNYLKKFEAVVLPDTSKIEEEDEDEEETITLDFTEDGVKAYEKMGEGVAVRNEDGTISLVDDVELADKIKKVLEKEEEPPLKKKYDAMLHDLIVSKAIASLIKKVRQTEDDMIKVANEKRMGAMNGVLEKEITDSLYNKRIELRAAIRGNGVNYDKIPVWAESYISEYMQDAIGGLVELTERD